MQNKESQRLRECPFCGGTKLKLESKSHKAGYTGIDALVEQDTYSVRCNICHARGGAAGGKVIKSHSYVYRNNMPKWAVTADELKQRAIEAWNRRAENEELKFTRQFIHEQGLEFALASAWKGRAEDGK